MPRRKDKPSASGPSKESESRRRKEAVEAFCSALESAARQRFEPAIKANAATRALLPNALAKAYDFKSNPANAKIERLNVNTARDVARRGLTVLGQTDEGEEDGPGVTEPWRPLNANAKTAASALFKVSRERVCPDACTLCPVKTDTAKTDTAS